MADGSIILDTRVNTKGAEADLKALQAKAKSTAQQIAAVEKDYNSTTSKHSKLGEDLRQTMATIGLSIIAADVALWIWGGEIYQFDPPRWISGTTTLPLVGKFSTYRLVLLATAVVIGVGLSATTWPGCIGSGLR